MREKQYLKAENIVVRFGEQEILHFDRFQIYGGERIGLVGVNGAGKTTLLELIRLAALEQSGQTLQRKNGKYWGMPAVTSSEPAGEAVRADTGGVAACMKEASRCVRLVPRACVGFFYQDMRDLDYDRSVLDNVLSVSIQLCFARLFVSRANLLILDEPTNYLDIPSVEALEKMFAEYEGTLVFVSHDQAFIQAVATEIWELQEGRLVKKAR